MYRKNRLVTCIVAASVITQVTSCGTVLHPERRGQAAGRLDPAIVVLDAVGLLVFLVPGVIAFAVDFSNGAIYLPPEQTVDAGPLRSQDLRVVRMSPAELTSPRIETIVEERTGRAVHLKPGAYRAMRLNQIDDFSSATLEQLQTSATPTVIVRGKSD